MAMDVPAARRPPVVRDFMDRTFPRLRPEMDIYEAIDVLLRQGVTGAPVVDASGRLVGILSERDCLHTLVQGAYNNLPSARVGDYMARELHTITPDTDIFKVAEFFTRNIYRRLLVLEDGQLVGQITRRDLLRAILALDEEMNGGPSRRPQPAREARTLRGPRPSP